MTRTLSAVSPCLLFCLAFGAASASSAADDFAVHLPPQYNTFIPPSMGQTYLDPVFGTRIKRVSDAGAMLNHAGVPGALTFISTEYSTASPFNSDNSLLILQHAGYFGLYDGAGTYLRDLPFVVDASTEPRWSRTDPNVLFYVSGNRLRRLSVSTGASTTVHTFTEYTAIRGRGESDISRDGDHFVFSADPPSGPANRDVFVYEISTDTKGPVLNTTGHAFNQIYLAPDNSVALGWIAGGTTRFTGVELFDKNMIFQRQLTHAIGHMHLTRDTNGDDLLIWTNSNDALPIQNCQNGIVKVRLSDARQTCLVQLDWSLAVHITAGDGDGWAFVETYNPSFENPTFPFDPLRRPRRTFDPPPANWVTYTNEILQVKLDGSETRRLLHHRSRETVNYGYQPRATVSRDGSTLVFTSNYSGQAIQHYADGYTDAYLIAVPASSLPRITIADGVLAAGAPRRLGFEVRLSHVSDVPVTVTFQTVNGSAQAPSDYTAVGPQTLTFHPLTRSQTVFVQIRGPLSMPTPESFEVILLNPSGGLIDDASGLGLIPEGAATLAVEGESPERITKAEETEPAEIPLVVSAAHVEETPLPTMPSVVPQSPSIVEPVPQQAKEVSGLDPSPQSPSVPTSTVIGWGVIGWTPSPAVTNKPDEPLSACVASEGSEEKITSGETQRGTNGHASKSGSDDQASPSPTVDSSQEDAAKMGACKRTTTEKKNPATF